MQRQTNTTLPREITDAQLADHRMELIRRFTGTPRQLDHALKQMVYGQDHAAETLAVVLHNHLRRAQKLLEGETVAPAGPLSRVLLIGPSGSGKTHLCRAAAGLTSLGISIYDASSITESAYVGNSTDDVIIRLLQDSCNDPDLGSVGVVVLDELDKCRRQDTHGSRDPSGEGAQASLLSLLDGSDIGVKCYAADRSLQWSTTFSAKHTMIVGAGAFVGLDQILRRRLEGKTRTGFSAGQPSPIGESEERNMFREVTHQDLIDYGMLPELVGRFGIIEALNPLSPAIKLEILRDSPYGPVKTLQAQAELSGFRLRFTGPLLLKIIDMTGNSPVGVRSLFGIAHKATQKAFFEVPDHTKNRRSQYCVPIVTVGLPSLVDGTYTLKWMAAQTAAEEPEDWIEA